jgi:hypothetical protein
LTPNEHALQTVGDNIHLLNDISGYCKVRLSLSLRYCDAADPSTVALRRPAS